MFLGAVVFSAWIGGWRTGLLAIALSSLMYAYKILPPVNSIQITDTYDLLRLTLFLGLALLLNSMQASRDRAEAMLRASQRRLNLALEAARMGAWELDIKSGEFWHSAGLCDLYGRPADRFTNTYEAFLGYIVSEDRSDAVRAIARVAQEGGTCELSHRIHCMDKSVRRLVTRCHAMVDENGKVARLVGVAMEVMEGSKADGNGPASPLQKPGVYAESAARMAGNGPIVASAIEASAIEASGIEASTIATGSISSSQTAIESHPALSV
jgi:PAS domain-containing protein